MTKPPELAEAEWVFGLCERFHCLPSQLLGEDVGLLRMLELCRLGTADANSEAEPWMP